MSVSLSIYGSTTTLAVEDGPTVVLQAGAVPLPQGSSLTPEDRAKLDAALAAASATISSAPDNRLKLEPDGLYVPPPQLASENW